jgi:hypothetical protein
MSDDNTPPRHRGLIWLIFFFPGTVILWWHYYFPKHGDVWTSARRKDVPAMQFLYSLAFWAVAALMLLIFFASAVSDH